MQLPFELFANLQLYARITWHATTAAPKLATPAQPLRKKLHSHSKELITSCKQRCHLPAFSLCATLFLLATASPLPLSYSPATSHCPIKSRGNKTDATHKNEIVDEKLKMLHTEKSLLCCCCYCCRRWCVVVVAIVGGASKDKGANAVQMSPRLRT